MMMKAGQIQQYYIIEVQDYRFDHEYGDCSLVEESGMHKYKDEYGEPYKDVEIQEASYLCSLNVKETFNDGRWDFISDSAFPLRIEFDHVKKLYNVLVTENAIKPVKKRRFGLGN